MLLRSGNLTVFNTVDVRHLGSFLNSDILTTETAERISTRDMPSFMAIGQVVAELWQFFDFGLVMRAFGPPTFGGLHCEKCGRNRCSGFNVAGPSPIFGQTFLA